MGTDVLDVLDNKSPLGSSADMVKQLHCAGNIAAGEDIMVNEAGPRVSPTPSR